MTRPPSWILCRVSSRRSASATKGGAGGAPPREALITGLLIAGLGKGVLEFEQDAGKGVVIGFEYAEPFRELADLSAAFFEQFGLLAFEALLFFFECLEACAVIGGIFHKLNLNFHPRGKLGPQRGESGAHAFTTAAL